MSIQQALDNFNQEAAQCASLIANAHGVDSTGVNYLPPVDREQITVAAFLNLFIAWESFLEAAVCAYMTGAATLNGNYPVRFASPANASAAKKMLIGTMRYFDFGNHFNFKNMALIYLDAGYPFEPSISQINSDLDDIRILRNAAAHITSSTQAPLEALALRLLGAPRPGVRLYELLVCVDPRPGSGGTVFATYAAKLTASADQIAHG